MVDVSNVAVPLLITIILGWAFIRQKPALTSFAEGAKNGIQTMLNIFPSLLALIVAVEVMNSSGVTLILTEALSPLFKLLKIPTEISPLVLIRPISGSGSTALLQSILEKYSPDSFAGMCASVISGSTETTFYTLTVYFAATKVKKTRYTAISALLADFVCTVVGCSICRLLLN